MGNARPPDLAAPGGVEDAALVAHGVKVVFEEGFITYYGGAHNDFYAACSRHGCRVTRTSTARASKPAQGRPLGFLTAWLQSPCRSTREHCSPAAKVFSYEERLAARRRFAEKPGARLLLALERPAGGSEPDGEPLANP